MADKHITDLLPAVGVGEGDEFHIAQGGVDKKLEYGIFLNAVTGGLEDAIEEAEELVEDATTAAGAAIAAEASVNQSLLSIEDILSQVEDIEDNVFNNDDCNHCDLKGFCNGGCLFERKKKSGIS